MMSYVLTGIIRVDGNDSIQRVLSTEGTWTECHDFYETLTDEEKASFVAFNIVDANLLRTISWH